jgi:hypothetical protein
MVARSRVSHRAHLLFLGGARIDEEPWQHAEAVTRTAELMSDARVPAIFGAAFEYENIRTWLPARRHASLLGFKMQPAVAAPKDARAKGKREKGLVWHGRGRVVVSLVAHRLNDAVDEGDRRV